MVKLNTIFHTMDVRFLVTFIEVAKTRHFGKAAENLYLTQSAVSARIKQLEEYFNTPLFIRHRHSIKLTTAGEALLPYAEKLAETLSEARKALSEVDVQHLVLAGTPNAWELFLQHGLMLIKEQFTELSVRAEILNIDQLSRQLHERSIDLAFSVEPLKSDDVENLLLGESELVFYTNLDMDLEEALQHYVHIDWGVKVTDIIEKQFPQVRKATLRTSSAQVGLEFVLKHGGCLALPRNLAAALLDQHKLTELQSIAPLTVGTYLIYLKDAANLGMQEFIEFFEGQHAPFSNQQHLRLAQH